MLQKVLCLLLGEAVENVPREAQLHVLGSGRWLVALVEKKEKEREREREKKKGPPYGPGSFARSLYLKEEEERKKMSGHSLSPTRPHKQGRTSPRGEPYQLPGPGVK